MWYSGPFGLSALAVTGDPVVHHARIQWFRKRGEVGIPTSCEGMWQFTQSPWGCTGQSRCGAGPEWHEAHFALYSAWVTLAASAWGLWQVTQVRPPFLKHAL